MRKKDQIVFVSALIDNVKKELLDKMVKSNLPESWDGFELRQLVADEFNACSGYLIGKRKKDYNSYKINNFQR